MGYFSCFNLSYMFRVVEIFSYLFIIFGFFFLNSGGVFEFWFGIMVFEIKIMYLI